MQRAGSGDAREHGGAKREARAGWLLCIVLKSRRHVRASGTSAQRTIVRQAVHLPLLVDNINEHSQIRVPKRCIALLAPLKRHRASRSTKRCEPFSSSEE
jgi:hypothetical protein